MSRHPWRLVDYKDYCEASGGWTVVVDVEDFGKVTIENWFASSGSGTDCYMADGTCVNDDLGEHLGEALYEELTSTYIYEVDEKYWEAMELMGIDEMRKRAFAAAAMAVEG